MKSIENIPKNKEPKLKGNHGRGFHKGKKIMWFTAVKENGKRVKVYFDVETKRK